MLNLAEHYLAASIKKGDQKSFELLFKSYYTGLCKYARNIVHMTRKHKQFTELSAETIEQLNALMPPDVSADPLRGIDMLELTDRIKKSIEHLPEECRKIFILSRTEELSHKEIAMQLKTVPILSVQECTISSWLKT